MNFLCHAIPYLDKPLLAVSTGVPDWLRVIDRKIRAREKLALPYLDSDDGELRMVAAGVIRHIKDDGWFHGTRAFVETNLELAVQLRDLLPGDAGFRPMFVGHILIEICLDACEMRDDLSVADRYYDALQSIPPTTIENCVNTITGAPTDQLTLVIERFTEVRFLYDYLDYDKLLMRLNQVMKRVGLPPLPGPVRDWLPEADKLIESRRQQLLTPPGATEAFTTIPSP
jgi:hypothetical protein